jgi:molecular chaperone DnaJ
MSKRDYYEVLGISRSASKDEINGAFRKLARQYHPDVSEAEDAEERFKEINEAKDVLLDDQKRAAYDRYGHAGVSRMGGVPDYSTIDLSEIFEDLFGFGFGGSSYRRGRRRNMPRKGNDLQYTLNLTFEESVFGVEKEVEITRDEICTRCEGSGAEPGTNTVTCPTCQGAGEVRQSRQTLFGSMVQVTTCPDCRGEGTRVETPCAQCRGGGYERKTVRKIVAVPAGIDNGRQIRLNGEGQPGANGGPNGDVYLAIKIKPHKYFRRRGNDILLDLDINVAQATLGADVTVPTVDGEAVLSIPDGVQPGKVLRMRNKGVPELYGNGRGDQLVVLNIEIPKHLSGEQRQIFEQLAESLGSEVHPQERGFFDRLKDVLGG